MPSLSEYFSLLFVNLGFILQILAMYYFKSALEIKENWALYRCNPPFWIFSDNIASDFNYCVQNTQVNLMGYLMQPFNYLINALTSVGGNFNNSINNIRIFIDNLRNFIKNIIQNIFGVFLNIIIEIQKIIISIKDNVGKIIGIVVTMLYILDGSIKTMNSAWKGPSGQLVRAIGSCFHPNTLLKLKNGELVAMKDILLGSELEDGSYVFSVMKLANFNNEPFYEIKGGYNEDNNIYVTGEHYIYDNSINKWIQVKDYKDAKLTNKSNYYFSCLITTNRRIKIGDITFWDWEDDEISNNIKLVSMNNKMEMINLNITNN